MSSISMNIPTFEINANEIHNLIPFIYKHEQILKEFGAIKIQLNIDCKLGLKKRRKNLLISQINKQILKPTKDNLIYSVKKVSHINKSMKEDCLIEDEATFWSKLSSLGKDHRQLNISLIQNKSFFYRKSSRIYFDLHRLPSQSLFKIAGKKVSKQFVPCVKRAHGPGAIFPLSSTEKNLFSIDYHHEGGNHHWYIIPSRERKSLQTIIDKQNSSLCLDHGQIFVHPSLLDKNQIRYHRIVQQPNEFVVLSSGSLAQSFTYDASWSESIDFALPSWIEQGYANISNPSCHCDIHQHSLSKTIDLNLFRHELIQKYISSTLNNIIHDKSILSTVSNDIDMTTVSTSNTIKDETMMSTNMKLIIPRQRILSSCQSPSTSLITQSIGSYFFEDDRNTSIDNNDQIHYKLLEQGHFLDVFDQKTADLSLVDSILSEHLFELDTQTSQPHQTSTTSINVHQDFINNSDIDNHFLLYEDLMDLLPSTEDSSKLTYGEADQSIDTNSPSTFSSTTNTTPVQKRNHNKQKRSLNQSLNNGKTLFVSGLRSTVNKRDLHSHFTGCKKVTIKQCHTTPHLKYAFVTHYTIEATRRNLRRSIDRYLLGPKCRVEYASNGSGLPSNHQSIDNRKVVVNRIPENVNENDLHYLFGNCHILKYCPARRIHRSATTTQTTNKNKILSGYAFILYDDEQQAANVIEHSDQYQINGQSLVVSLYRH